MKMSVATMIIQTPMLLVTIVAGTTVKKQQTLTV
jgi:hypothetical protein